jgi:hypothetical protein
MKGFVALVVSVIVLSVIFLVIGLNGRAERQWAAASLQATRNDQVRIKYQGEVDLELAKAEADKVRERAAAETLVINAGIQQQMLLLEEARKDSAHRRSQENLIALAVISGTTSSMAMVGLLLWSTLQERNRDRVYERRESLEEESRRRFWHAVAQMGRSR